MKLTKGIILKAKGGWNAEVAWIRADKQEFYAVHRPGITTDLGLQNTNGESYPTCHCPDGTAHSVFSINEPLCYEADHPADLEMGEYEL